MPALTIGDSNIALWIIYRLTKMLQYFQQCYNSWSNGGCHGIAILLITKTIKGNLEADCYNDTNDGPINDNTTIQKQY